MNLSPYDWIDVQRCDLAAALSLIEQLRRALADDFPASVDMQILEGRLRSAVRSRPHVCNPDLAGVALRARRRRADKARKAVA